MFVHFIYTITKFPLFIEWMLCIIKLPAFRLLHYFQDSQNGLSLGSASGQAMYADEDELQKQMAGMALGLNQYLFQFN